MRYSEVEKRLATLEQGENVRQERVHDRILQQLSDSELDCYIDYLGRWIDDDTAMPTAAELSALQRVYDLTRADPEACSSDWLNASWGGTYA